MANELRKQLTSQAKAYVDACERDLEGAQKRLHTARKILDYLGSGRSVGNSPTPLLNETSAQAERFAARVDVLLFTVWEDEGGDETKV